MVKTSSSTSRPLAQGQGRPASTMAELMAAHTSSFNVYKKGQEVEGTVKKLTSKEILLDIGAKSDALVLEVEKVNMDNLMAILHLGDKVRAVIISPEAEEGFPVVSLRRALDTMLFADFDKAVSNQETVEVTVLEPTRGGYYAEAGNGIRGFLPQSQVMGTESLNGKKISVKIIEADRSKKRLIFSQKATEYETNSDTLKALFPKGTKVEVEVTSPTSYGMYVVITPKKGEKKGKLVEGFIHISEISFDRIENLSAIYKKGDRVQAAVLDLDVENRRVNLSIKATLTDNFAEVAQKFKKEDKVKGTVKDVKTRGVTVELEDKVRGFIPADKIPAETTYKVGDSISAEVSSVDLKRRVVVLSPVVTKAFVGYR